MMFVYDWLNMRSISILRQKGISLSMILYDDVIEITGIIRKY